MAVTITVGGTDRTEFWKRERTNFEVITNGRGKASGIVFEVPVGHAFRPTDGQLIVILEDATVRYRGILLEPEEERFGDKANNDFVRFDCAASDYNLIADRRIIAATFEDTAFEDIVDGIVSNANNDGLTGEGITQTNVEAGAAIDKITFNYVTVTEAFNVLSELTGKAWFIDEDKDLHFKATTSDPAPATLDGDIALDGTVHVRPDRQKYRNKQIVLAGTDIFPIVAVGEDATEQAARAALEGTSGIYDRVTQAEDITSGAVALEYANDLIARFGIVSKVIELDTRTAGYAAGQAGTANFPEHDVNSEACFIEEVNGYIHEELDEVWYKVRAITGDPFGGWMEHFRKDETRKPPLIIGPPAPGQFDLVAIEPGSLVHDPPPGTGEWFQAAASGTLDFTPTAAGITHDLAYYVSVRRTSGPNTTHVELYAISSQKVPDTTPESSFTFAEIGATTYKDAVVISEDNTKAAFVQYGAPGKFVVVDIAGDVLLGSVDSNLSAQGNGGEPVWIGDYVYWPDVSTGDIYVYDVTDPANPVEAQIFTTSLSACSAIVANELGSFLFACGTGSSLVVSLDLSTPDAITEADTVVVTGTYNSLGIQNNNLLVMFIRASASTVRWAAIDIGGAGALTLNTESTLALSTAEMDGYACVAGGDRAFVLGHRTAPSSANTLKGHVFNISDVTAVTLVETLSYNHATVGNQPGTKTDRGLAVLNVFGFNTDAQVTYAEIAYPDIVPITIDRPQRVGFGGTGIGAFDKGDIIYAGELLPTDNRFNGALSRLGIGASGQLLGVNFSGKVPEWQDPPDALPQPFGASGTILAMSGSVPAWLAPGFIEHNLLSGLVVGDPHTQYLPADGSRPYTGTADFGGQLIDNAPWFAGYIDGLETANASDASHDVTVSPGVATDSLAGNDLAIRLEAELTKQIDAAWSEGDAAGGMATGTVANTTEYNLILITKDADGTVDLTFDVDPAGGNAPTGWTARRRIGSVFTDGSANILEYNQAGDDFRFINPPLDVNDTGGTLLTHGTGTLTVPANALAVITGQFICNSCDSVTGLIREVGSAAFDSDIRLQHGAGGVSVDTLGINGELTIFVDGSSQMEYTLNATGGGSEAWNQVAIWTKGWTDKRGRHELAAEEETIMLVYSADDLINNGSGVTRASGHATGNVDVCAFRFGSVQDRVYILGKLPESFVGQECHVVGVFSHASAAITGTGDDLIKLEVGYGLFDNDGVIPDVGTAPGTAPVDVEIDHEFPFTQYSTQALELAVFTPSATQRHIYLRLMRDGTEETSDGSRLATNLHCHCLYIVPTALDVGGYVVPDTVT